MTLSRTNRVNVTELARKYVERQFGKGAFLWGYEIQLFEAGYRAAMRSEKKKTKPHSKRRTKGAG